MSTFEEQFPSLKGNIITDDPHTFLIAVDDKGNILSTLDSMKVIAIPRIEKHCLDKQKVREVLFKYVNGNKMRPVNIYELLTELGYTVEINGKELGL